MIVERSQRPRNTLMAELFDIKQTGQSLSGLYFLWCLACYFSIYSRHYLLKRLQFS